MTLADTSATAQGAVLADFFDSLGRRVTATVTNAGTLAILTRTPETGLKGGHPALTPENARELGEALIAFADREAS